MDDEGLKQYLQRRIATILQIHQNRDKHHRIVVHLRSLTLWARSCKSQELNKNKKIIKHLYSASILKVQKRLTIAMK